MNALKRKLSLHALIACAAWYCPLLASPFIYRLCRRSGLWPYARAVQSRLRLDRRFATGPNMLRCRPVRRTPVTAMPTKPKLSEPNDRVRLKASSFNGM